VILPVALLLLGLGLLIAEVLFPSLGTLGILSAVSVVASVFFAFRVGSGTGWAFLVVAVCLVPVTAFFAYRLFPRTPMGRRMILSGSSFPAPERTASDPRAFGLEGKTGTVLAPLRPAGVADIEGRRIDVVSRGEFIPAGARVRVLEFSGNRVVVSEES
jgi:membrane-bound serine protease (ClpP class)